MKTSRPGIFPALVFPYGVRFVFIVMCIFQALTGNAQVIIPKTASDTLPDASAALDIRYDNRGVLIPRMTYSQRIAIAAPANGLLVYQTDSVSATLVPGFYFNAGTSSSVKWVQLDPYYTTGVTAGIIGNTSGGFNVPYFTVNKQGRLSQAANRPLLITNTPSWSIKDSAILPGNDYLRAFGRAQGQINAIKSSIGSIHNPLSLGTANGLSLDVPNQVLSLGLASSSAAGALSAGDWTNFNTAFGWGDHTVSNVGAGTGQIYRDKTGSTINLKTLIAADGLSLSNNTSDITLTNSKPDQIVSLTGTGIVSIGGGYPDFTISATEVDGSTTNELQNLSYTSSSRSLGISSGSGVSLPLFSTTGSDAGLVPGSAGIGATYFLNGNGYWSIPPDNNTTYSPGYRLSLAGTTFHNADYWKNQDSLNVSDGLVLAANKKLSSITNNSANWNTAFGWGDHTVSNVGSGTGLVFRDKTGSNINLKTLLAGTAMLVTNNANDITIANTAPDQTVVINGGGINTVSGSYPNFTITGTEVDGSVTNEIQSLSYAAASRDLAISGSNSVTLPLFSTSSTNAGLIPGSSNVGSTYYLNGNGGWSVPPDNNNTYSAGYRMTLAGGTTFHNTSYWKNQDTLNVADGLVLATSKKLTSITNNSVNWNTAYGWGDHTVSNVGSGTGQVYRDKTGSNINLRTLLAGTGIYIANNANDITITNTSPDQTVTLSGGGIVTIGGFYPNYTITATEVDGSTSNELQDLSYTASTGAIGITSGSGITLPLFSTSSTSRGLVTGSNSLGSTYFLNGSGSWSVPNFISNQTSSQTANFNITSSSTTTATIANTNASGTALAITSSGTTAGKGVDVSNNCDAQPAGKFSNANSSGTGIIAVGNNVSAAPLLTTGAGGQFFGSTNGLYAYANGASSSYAGYFQSGTSSGYVYAYVCGKNASGTAYGLVTNGKLSYITDKLDGSKSVVFAQAAPEILLSDFGTGTLSSGTCHIDLDPDYSNNISVNSDHPIKVFIQLEGECNGVFVANKSKYGFDVIELHGGASNVSFSWSVVANRADLSDNKGIVYDKNVGVRFPKAPELNGLK
ncbi:MAG TPA: hypothetical protein PLK82_02965 [Bacteroidales bacterium]|nr:hypothetical protein [Bacteroidales bacterium]